MFEILRGFCNFILTINYFWYIAYQNSENSFFYLSYWEWTFLLHNNKTMTYFVAMECIQYITNTLSYSLCHHAIQRFIWQICWIIIRKGVWKIPHLILYPLSYYILSQATTAGADLFCNSTWHHDNPYTFILFIAIFYNLKS